MKKSLYLLLASFLTLLGVGTGCAKNDGLTRITLAEVTHSIFYAPQYVALEKGYFEEEGLKVNIITTPGADKTMAALLSKEAQIGLMGPEASVYVYNGGEKDYAINFAQLTHKDGSFLLAREEMPNFTWNDVKGKTIIGGRKGGMPEMTFEYTLKENNIDLNDLTIDTSVDFASMAGTFISGVGDFVTLFEPSATQVEQKGYGYVVGYIGEYGGSVPYTAYNARKSYISENKDTIQKFTNAINKGLDFVWNNDEETVAKVIVNQFPDLTINELSKMIKRYKDNDAWMKNTYFTEESFDHLQDIMIEAGELKTKVPYKDLVDTSFSKSE